MKQPLGILPLWGLSHFSQKFSGATTVDLTRLKFEPFIPEVQWSNHCGYYPFKFWAIYPRSSVEQPLWILPVWSLSHLSPKLSEATAVDLTPLKFEPRIPEVQWSNHCGSYPFKVWTVYPRSSVKQPISFGWKTYEHFMPFFEKWRTWTKYENLMKIWWSFQWKKCDQLMFILIEKLKCWWFFRSN